jgi:hypothetical protein
VADWVTISALATAGGTLVLAAATFASVRSATRTARTAERSLLAGLRPVLAAARLDDPVQKVMFAGPHWVVVKGGRATTEVTEGVVYVAGSLRNVGTGMAVLHSWHFVGEISMDNPDHAPVGTFRRLSRDIYIAPNDLGFWQGAFREPDEAVFAEARQAFEERRPCTVEVMYGDLEGGQRAISRFTLVPAGDNDWLASTSRHWNLDRADPR